MRRVPNRRGYIVMADSLHSLGLLNIVVLLMYLCVMKDVLFERLFFWSFRPKICTYLKICVAIEGNGNANLYLA